MFEPKILSKLKPYFKGIDGNWIVSKVWDRKGRTGSDQGCERCWDECEANKLFYCTFAAQ